MGGVSLSDASQVRDVLAIEEVRITDALDLNGCELHQVVRLRGVEAKRFALVDCEIRRDLEAQSCTTSLLDIHGSSLSGTVDFRGAEFEELDVLSLRGEGAVLLEERQLKRPARVKSLLGRSGYETPSKVLGDGASDPAAVVKALQQLFTLREKFHRIPSMADQEDYCAYRLMEASRRLKSSSLAKAGMLLNKWCLGYIIVTARILITMILTITGAACFYAFGTALGVGDLLQAGADGAAVSVFDDGPGVGLFRCLYFSVVTFTTLGYGDIHAAGASRLIAMLEAMLGIILTSLFTVSVARRALRW